MFGTSIWDLIFYAIAILSAIVLFGRPESVFNKTKTTIYINKVLWSFLVISLVYCGLTVPYISGFINFPSNKIEIPIQQNEVKHLENHQRRILYLEQKLEQTNNDLKEFRQHYYMLMQIFMYGLLFYGITKITKSNEKELEEIKEDSIFKL
jgi:hypothetical protein